MLILVGWVSFSVGVASSREIGKQSKQLGEESAKTETVRYARYGRFVKKERKTERKQEGKKERKGEKNRVISNAEWVCERGCQVRRRTSNC